MAGLKVKFLPTTIVDLGDQMMVSGQVTFDGGDYATGGVQGAWDYNSAPSANLGGFKKVSTVKATRTPKNVIFQCGDSAFAMYGVKVTGSPLVKVLITQASDGTQVAATALAAGLQSPVAPHQFTFFYNKNL